MYINCPYCGEDLDVPEGFDEPSVECPACHNSFPLPQSESVLPYDKPKKVRAFLKEWQGLVCAFLVGSSIMVSTIIWVMCDGSGRYMIARGGDNIVYRTDRRSGETVMMRGTSMRVVGEISHAPERKRRMFTIEELKKIKGRGSSEDSSDGHGRKKYFRGVLYNGNTNLCVSVVRIALKHKLQNGNEEWREYDCAVTIPSLQTTDFGFYFLRDFEPLSYFYPWRLVSAEGCVVDGK